MSSLRAQTWLDARAAAAEMHTPLRTVKRWLAAWHALGVAGIERVPAPGGFAYRISRQALRRWRACALPSPQPSARAA